MAAMNEGCSGREDKSALRQEVLDNLQELAISIEEHAGTVPDEAVAISISMTLISPVGMGWSAHSRARWINGRARGAPGQTPVQGLTIQDVSIDIAGDIKELKGANQFPDDTARGDIKATGKFSIGRKDMTMFNQIFFADVVAAGGTSVAPDTATRRARRRERIRRAIRQQLGRSGEIVVGGKLEIERDSHPGWIFVQLEDAGLGSLARRPEECKAGTGFALLLGLFGGVLLFFEILADGLLVVFDVREGGVRRSTSGIPTSPSSTAPPPPSQPARYAPKQVP